MEVALACANGLGESPVWSVSEQALYWVDIRAPSLNRLDADGRHRSWPMPELCGAVVRARHGVIVALRTGLRRFDPATGAFEAYAEVEPPSRGNRLNETKCDRHGAIWVGSMRDFGVDVNGALYRVGPDRSVTRIFDRIRIPNSLGWSPDGGTMYFADTGEGTLNAHRVDPATGLPGPPRPLLPAGAAPGHPDGVAVDAEGFVWNARPRGGCVIRIAPDGRIDRTIALPVTGPTSCALGGADLRTLYVTTTRQRLTPEELARQPEAGHLFATRVDVPGLPEPVAG